MNTWRHLHCICKFLIIFNFPKFSNSIYYVCYIILNIMSINSDFTFFSHFFFYNCFSLLIFSHVVTFCGAVWQNEIVWMNVNLLGIICVTVCVCDDHRTFIWVFISCVNVCERLQQVQIIWIWSELCYMDYSSISLYWTQHPSEHIRLTTWPQQCTYCVCGLCIY